MRIEYATAGVVATVTVPAAHFAVTVAVAEYV
jgi:hypothetical protein